MSTLWTFISLMKMLFKSPLVQDSPGGQSLGFGPWDFVDFKVGNFGFVISWACEFNNESVVQASDNLGGIGMDFLNGEVTCIEV